MNKRQLLMALALLVASWFAFVADKTPTAEPVSRSAPAQGPASQPVPAVASAKVVDAGNASLSATGSASLALLRLRERAPYAAAPAGTRRNFALFGVTAWDPPAPKVATGPPAAPQAPPLPYSYLGKKWEAGRWEVYLALGEDTRVVRPHSRLDEKYRIDTIAPPTLSLTYLPLMQVQTLNIGTTE
jgi:hypothetical protein